VDAAQVEQRTVALPARIDALDAHLPVQALAEKRRDALGMLGEPRQHADLHDPDDDRRHDDDEGNQRLQPQPGMTQAAAGWSHCVTPRDSAFGIGKSDVLSPARVLHLRIPNPESRIPAFSP